MLFGAACRYTHHLPLLVRFLFFHSIFSSLRNWFLVFFLWISDLNQRNSGMFVRIVPKYAHFFSSFPQHACDEHWEVNQRVTGFNVLCWGLIRRNDHVCLRGRTHSLIFGAGICAEWRRWGSLCGSCTRRSTRCRKERLRWMMPRLPHPRGLRWRWAEWGKQIFSLFFVPFSLWDASSSHYPSLQNQASCCRVLFSLAALKAECHLVDLSSPFQFYIWVTRSHLL